MIDLETLERMVASNEMDRLYAGPKAPRKLIAITNPEARYKGLKSSASNAGIKLDGKFKTLAGFTEWLGQFDPSVLTYDWCISCKCFDPNEKVMNEHTTWIIPRRCLNYLTVRAGRKTAAVGVRLLDYGKYQTISKGLYYGSYDTLIEAHLVWLNDSITALEELLVEIEQVIDLVTRARIEEIIEGMREHISARTQLKQHAVSKLDREVLKQQYFNSLKETKQ